jgi:hypothetical protein
LWRTLYGGWQGKGKEIFRHSIQIGGMTARTGIGLAKLAPAATTSDDERRTPRYRLLLTASAGTPPAGLVNVLIHDISADGIRIETRTPVAIGAEIAIELPNVGEVLAEVIRQDGPVVGAAFRVPLDRPRLKAVLSAADIVWLPDGGSRADRRDRAATRGPDVPQAWLVGGMVLLAALLAASLAWLQTIPEMLIR